LLSPRLTAECRFVTNALDRNAQDFTGRHILSIRDFSRLEIEQVLDEAQHHEISDERLLTGQVMATLFFEPSTRTRLSFEAAMQHLGGTTLGFASASVSSASKGESLRDTVRVISDYCSVIVLRHPLEGSARAAAEVSKVPVINGGDGANQHPTQTFLDLFTIRQACGRLDGLRVGFLGDLKYGRTVHSLASALAGFDSSMVFISPPELRLPEDLAFELAESGVRCDYIERPEEVLHQLDVLYVTRIQKERFADPIEYDRVKGAYRVDKASLARAPQLRVMHPLPRVDEIASDVDALPQALYFTQARNGVTVRKALLALVLGKRLAP
jgi:aspartate carbamoyltransferase catalytic subunit